MDTGLLTLPWELRSAIFIEVLKQGRSQEPVFDRKVAKSRIRLRNRFDSKFPEATNIYIQKPKSRYLHASALLATNRQLRHEITLLINKELKTGRIEIPFILDIMYAKDVGVFPTWMSFPYKSKRILRLRINIRIVRPDASVIPSEWIEAARYPPADCSLYGSTLSTWNLFAVLVLYSLGRLSIANSAGTYYQVGDELGRSQAGRAKRGISTTDMKQRQWSQTKRAIKESILHHKSSVSDAYLVLMESTLYVVDDLFIDMKSLEYQANGKIITPAVEDSPSKSRFFKEGYVQFGRDVFCDFNPRWMDSDDIDFELQSRALGRISSEQLQYRIWEVLFGSIKEPRVHLLGLYHDVLANSVGGVSISRADNFETVILYKMTEDWFKTWDEDYSPYDKTKIRKQIAAEEAKDNPDTDYIAQLRTIKRRITLGWPAQHRELFKMMYG